MGLGLAAALLVVGAFLLFFGQAMLDGYGKGKLERGFAVAHPGSVLRIGELHYAIGAGRLVARAVALRTAGNTGKIDQLTISGLRWAPLLHGSTATADLLAASRFEAAGIEVSFADGNYLLRCAQLRGSVPGSDLTATGIELLPRDGDEAFFAAHPYRTPRFKLQFPECHVIGLAYRELLQGTAYRAASIACLRPALEVLINGDKPAAPSGSQPLMVHEALAAFPQPLQVESLSITNGLIRYSKRAGAGIDPAVLSFSTVSASVSGIANRGPATSAISLLAQGDLMGAGSLKVRLTIPILPPAFSLHYSGSLSAMDLTRLTPFLDPTEHVRIMSGHVREAAFEIEVATGAARGLVRASYEHLKIALLDRQTGSAAGLDDRFTSFLANLLKLRSSNAPGNSGLMKEGKVNYTKQPQEEFLEFLWFALWSGVKDVICQ